MNSLEGLPKSAYGVLREGAPASANIPKGQDEGGAAPAGLGSGDFAELLSGLAVADEKGRPASHAISRALAARKAPSDGERADRHEALNLPATDAPAPFRGTLPDAVSPFSCLSERMLKDRIIEGAEAHFSDGEKSVARRRAEAEGVDRAVAGLGQGAVVASDAVGDFVGLGDPVRQGETAARSCLFGPAPKPALEPPLDFPAAALDRDGGHKPGAVRGPRLDSGRKTPLAPTEAVIAPVFPSQSAGGDLAGGEIGPRGRSVSAPDEGRLWRIGERPADFPRQVSADAHPDAVAAGRAESPLGADLRSLARSEAIGSTGRGPDLPFAAAGKISILDQQTFLPPAASPSLANQLALLIGAEAAALTAGPSLVNDPFGPGRPADVAPAAPGASPVKILTLQLQPESLGIVTISMRLSGAQLDLQVEVEASNPDAARLIDGDRDLLAQRLRAHGISMEALVIKTAEATAHAPGGIHHAQGGPSASEVHAAPSSPSTPQHGEFARHERFARAKDDEPARTGSTGALLGVGDGRPAGELYI